MGSRGRHNVLAARRTRRAPVRIRYHWAGQILCVKPGAVLSFVRRLTDREEPLRDAYERAVAAESERLMRRITAEEASG